MKTREIILHHLAEVVEGSSPLPFPDDVTDETRLDEFWLDSVALVALLSNLEEALGFMPEAVLQGESFPKTVGDFVAMYTSSEEA